jgi:hypothetical protein
MSSLLVFASDTDNQYLLSNISLMNTRIDNTILNIIIQKGAIDIDTTHLSIKYDNLNKITGYYIGIYNLYNKKKYDITTTYKLRSCFYNYLYLISAYYAYHKMIDAYKSYLSSSPSTITFNDYIQNEYIKTLLSSCEEDKDKLYYNDVIKHINAYKSQYMNQAIKILIINYYRNLLLFDLHKFERISTTLTDVLYTTHIDYNTPDKINAIITYCINPNHLTTNFNDDKKIKDILNNIYKKNQEIVKRYPLITSEQYITIPQYAGICWFISTISGMCYSELSRKLILSKIIENFERYGITPSNDYIYNELIKKPGPDESETLPSLYRKFVLFVYYIIINITNEKKKYNDFASNQELLIKILMQFKTFPEYFLKNIAILSIEPSSSVRTELDDIELGTKRKADNEANEDNEYTNFIKDIKSYINSCDTTYSYYILSERVKKYKKECTIKLNELITTNIQQSKKQRSVPVVADVEDVEDVEDVDAFDEPDINKLDISCITSESIISIIEAKTKEIEELTIINQKIDEIYAKQMNIALADERSYFITNKGDGSFGISKAGYNIISHFYSYLSISVLFLYIDDDKKIYFPKGAPSLNNISDYDVIIISRLSLKVLEPTKIDTFYNIETDNDCNGDKIFNDVADFIAKFKSSGTFKLPENIDLLDGNNFELDFILHSSIPEFSHTNSSHCISSFRYPTETDYVSHNSSYINNIIYNNNARIIIPNILIKNDWHSHINKDDKYAILQGYIKELNVKDYYYNISYQADKEAIYYSYDTNIRFVYIKKNNLDNLSADVNAIIQQVKGVAPMAVEGGNRNKSQKNNLMRNIKSNNFFSRLRI